MELISTRSLENLRSTLITIHWSSMMSLILTLTIRSTMICMLNCFWCSKLTWSNTWQEQILRSWRSREKVMVLIHLDGLLAMLLLDGQRLTQPWWRSTILLSMMRWARLVLSKDSLRTSLSLRTSWQTTWSWRPWVQPDSGTTGLCSSCSKISLPCKRELKTKLLSLAYILI